MVSNDSFSEEVKKLIASGEITQEQIDNLVKESKKDFDTNKEKES